MISRSLLFAASTTVLAAATAGLAFGFSSATIFQMFFSTEWAAVFASCLNIGGLVGSILCGYLLSNYGRRWTVFCACIPGLIGWAWLRISAHTVYERYGPTVLFIAGRLLTGVSAGMIIPASATYLVEIAPPPLYSIFGMLTQIGIVTGILMAYVFGALFAWDHTAMINAVIMLLTLILSSMIPESPKWLMKAGRVQQANTVYTELRGTLPQTLENDDEKTEGGEANGETMKVRSRDYFFPCLAIPASQQPRLRIAVLLMILQQLTGINAVLYFAESVCVLGGLSVPSMCAVLLGVSQLVFTIIGVFIIDRYTRKRLLQYSAIIMCVSHFTYGCITMFVQPYGPWGYLGKLCIIIFLFGFSIGWGPLPVLVIMDLFPVSTRGFAGATGVAFNWITSFVVTMSFELLTVYVGAAYIFWAFSLCCLVCYLFASRYIPQNITTDAH